MMLPSRRFTSVPTTDCDDVVRIAPPRVRYIPSLDLDAVTKHDGTSGDIYTGLDRFGRLAQTLWKKGSAVLVQTSYGRNRMGSVTWKRDDKAHSLSTPVLTQDHYYWYDALQQVRQHDRGELTPSTPPYTGITNLQQREIFTFDETGNWQSYNSTSPSVTQTRTHNKANWITDLSGPSGVIDPVYAATGNMTTMPKVDLWTAGYTLEWDAWNRLTKVMEGATNIVTNAYDALTRRTHSVTMYANIRDYYYDKAWRPIYETTVEDPESDRDYVWGLDRWTLVRRRSNTFSDTQFALRDYLDPAAIVDTSGNMLERYTYDAFGPVNIMDASFVPRSGNASNHDWNFLFHGEFRDDVTKLYNYGCRFYHESLGRWLSRDPIEEPGGLNLYIFASNRSPNLADAFGFERL